MFGYPLITATAGATVGGPGTATATAGGRSHCRSWTMPAVCAAAAAAAGRGGGGGGTTPPAAAAVAANYSRCRHFSTLNVAAVAAAASRCAVAANQRSTFSRSMGLTATGFRRSLVLLLLLLL